MCKCVYQIRWSIEIDIVDEIFAEIDVVILKLDVKIDKEIDR